MDGFELLIRGYGEQVKNAASESALLSLRFRQTTSAASLAGVRRRLERGLAAGAGAGMPYSTRTPVKITI